MSIERVDSRVKRQSVQGCSHGSESRSRSLIRRFEEIPGPDRTPILGWRGNLLSYLRDPITFLFSLREKYGEVARLAPEDHPALIFAPTGNDHGTVFALGSSAARDVLTNGDDFGIGAFRAPEELGWINRGLVNANGKEHQRYRRALLPAFDRQRLREFLPVVQQEIDLCLDDWLDKGTVDLVAELRSLATRIAGACFFGQTPSEDRTQLAATVRDFAEAMMSPLSSIRLDFPGTPYRKLLRTGQLLQDEFFEAVESRRKSAKGPDLLSLMVQDQMEGRRDYADEDLLSNAVGVFLAGHDVPASAITFNLLLLSQHPAAAAELDRELAEAVHGQPDIEQLWRLPVLDATVKESLRLLGPALTIFRKTLGPARLGDFEVPPNTEVLVCPMTIHHDPNSFAEPRKFRPERWRKGKPGPFEFIPFSYGSRRCLGASFGELMMKIVLAAVARRVRMTPEPSSRLDLQCTFVIAPKGRIDCKVVPQDHRFEESRVPLRGKITELVDFPG